MYTTPFLTVILTHFSCNWLIIHWHYTMCRLCIPHHRIDLEYLLWSCERFSFCKAQKQNCASTKEKICYFTKLSDLVSIIRKEENLEWSSKKISPLLLSLLKKTTADVFLNNAMYWDTYFNLAFVEITTIVKIFPINPISRKFNKSTAENIIPDWLKGRT